VELHFVEAEVWRLADVADAHAFEALLEELLDRRGLGGAGGVGRRGLAKREPGQRRANNHREDGRETPNRRRVDANHWDLRFNGEESSVAPPGRACASRPADAQGPTCRGYVPSVARAPLRQTAARDRR